MLNRCLFLTLRVFSATGGIEKVCRVMGKALYERGLQQHRPVLVYSMYDAAEAADHNLYFPSEMFRGFSIRKAKFMQEAIFSGARSQLVILSHINLLLAAGVLRVCRF